MKAFMMAMKKKIWFIVLLAFLALLLLACAVEVLPPTPIPTAPATPIPSRTEVIPAGAHKYIPEEDIYPPIIHLADYYQPVPMPGPINTAGGEDSPFISTDGSLFLFFFTPDVQVPAELQLVDGVTGIWWMRWNGSTWGTPQRAVLNDDLSLDGCPFYQDGELWFCSARVGNLREIDIYTARLEGDTWQDWQNAGTQVNLDVGVGELHISVDGTWMVFHQLLEDGNMDLFMTQKTADGWGAAVNLGSPINTELYEGWPFLTPDGDELWFTRPSLTYPGPSIWRSFRIDGGWSEPQEIISSFAGESTMDAAGNIYFTHHFYSADGQMLEADIYVAYRK